MSPSSSSAVDKRGFFFVLPPLGLPDPGGQWCVLKAAIGVKKDVLLPLIQRDIQALPLREKGDEDGLHAVDCRGAAWVFPLIKPSSSPRAAELFKVFVKRLPPREVDALRVKLPPACDWLRLPIETYAQQRQMDEQNSTPAPAQNLPELNGYHLVQWGTTAELTPDQTPWWEREEKVEGEMSEWDVLMRKNMFKEEWYEQVYAEKLREEAQRGKAIDGATLRVRTRIHPAKNDDFRSLDYIVVTESEVIQHTAANTPFPEHRWKPLPLNAMKPGAYRQNINIVRRDAGKRIFSREEWPPAPVT